MEANKETILLVDDDHDITRLLSNELEGEGFNVLTEDDGHKGLVLALNKEPDLILADIGMPTVNGFEMIKEIRDSGEWGKNVSIIIFSAYEKDEKIMAEVEKYKPILYLLKPKNTIASVVEAIKNETASK